MTKSRKNYYKIDLLKFEWNMDTMPSKKLKNFKRKDRQRAKKKIKKELKEE